MRSAASVVTSLMMAGSVRGVSTAPVVDLADVRRLALHAQDLAHDPPGRPPPGEESTRVAEVVRRLGCLQLDPVATVARSPRLVLAARIGAVADEHIAAAAYRDRSLFEYWAHEASLCHVDDLPIHRAAMRRHLDGSSPRVARRRAFLEANAAFARSIVRTLRRDGPLPARALTDRSAQPWRHGHWTDEVSSRQTVARMLDALWMTGRIGVADRAVPGAARRWDLLERCLPAGAPTGAVRGGVVAVTRAAALRAVRMLGVARAADVRSHFTRGRYDDLPGVLARLARPAGPLTEVAVRGDGGDLLPGPWYVHEDDLVRLGDLAPGRAAVALSPFDNLLCDRRRTETVFGFSHRLEIYVPAGRRRWGYYVLPILVGERLVARADAALDRGTGVLRVHRLHREPGADDREARDGTDAALHRLSTVVGAVGVEIARMA